MRPLQLSFCLLLIACGSAEPEPPAPVGRLPNIVFITLGVIGLWKTRK